MGERPSLGIRAASPVQQLLSHPTSPCLSFPNLQMGQLRHRDGVTGPAVSHCRGEWQPKPYGGLTKPGAFSQCSVLLSPAAGAVWHRPCCPHQKVGAGHLAPCAVPAVPPLALRC